MNISIHDSKEINKNIQQSENNWLKLNKFINNIKQRQKEWQNENRYQNHEKMYYINNRESINLQYICSRLKDKIVAILLKGYLKDKSQISKDNKFKKIFQKIDQLNRNNKSSKKALKKEQLQPIFDEMFKNDILNEIFNKINILKNDELKATFKKIKDSLFELVVIYSNLKNYEKINKRHRFMTVHNETDLENLKKDNEEALKESKKTNEKQLEKEKEQIEKYKNTIKKCINDIEIEINPKQSDKKRTSNKHTSIMTQLGLKFPSDSQEPAIKKRLKLNN